MVVISAMGKTTNALERVLHAYFTGDKTKAASELASIRSFHQQIAGELIPDPKHALFGELDNIFTAMEKRLENRSPGAYNQEYDQLVSWGEITIHHHCKQLSDVIRYCKSMDRCQGIS